MEFWETIGISLIFGSSGGGLLFLFFSEKIKSKIQHEYNLKFEIARNELEKKATKFQIQYSKLHIERAKKLKEIYEKLLNAENSLKHYTNIGQDSEWFTDTSREKQAEKDLNSLKEINLKSRIYFEEGLCIKMDNIIDDYSNTINEMKEAKEQRIYENSSNIKIEPTALKKWFIVGNKTKTEMQDYRKLIEIEFRKILGIIV